MYYGVYQESTRHGEAWKAFTKHMRETGVTVPDQLSHELWPVFLAGWKAKGKQRVDLRNDG
jgi:hypothetical protein